MEIRGRASDALDKCSKRAIRDGRVAEIKQAILNSKKLQVRFDFCVRVGTDHLYWKSGRVRLSENLDFVCRSGR